MKKLTITNLEVLNIIAWFNQLTPEKQSAIPMKLRYYLKKLLAKISQDGKSFEEFRDEEIKSLQEKYSSDEKSYEESVPMVDDNNEPILDAEGNQEMNLTRKIRDEYMEEYQEDVNVLNNKISELLSEKNVYEINTYDIDAMVDSLPDDTPLEFDDINILDAIFTKGMNETTDENDVEAR